MDDIRFDAADGFADKEGTGGKVHIRVQQRNGRKSWTTVQGIPDKVKLPKSGKVFPVDFDKLLRALKKIFQTNGTLIADAEHGKILQMQGDLRKDIAQFLIVETMLVTKEQVMVHGAT